MTAAPTRAVEVVRAARVTHRVHEYALTERHGRERDERPRYGVEAASALGVEPGRVFKTLVALVDDRLVLAVVPASAELDLKRLAAASGGRRAVMADPAVAERATGLVVGGISPMGTKRQLPTLIDDSAGRYSTVFVSAGRRGLQIELAPGDLVRLCKAALLPIARDQGPG